MFFDDNKEIHECAGFPVVGTSGEVDDYPDYDVIVAIGNASIRKQIHKQVGEVRLATLIHPQAVISRRVTIGKGTVVMAGAVINSDTKLVKDVLLIQEHLLIMIVILEILFMYRLEHMLQEL